MVEPQYALVTEWWDSSHCPHRTDIAVDDNNRKFYQILQIAPEMGRFTTKLLKRFAVVRVQRILDAKDGDLRWKILK